MADVFVSHVSSDARLAIEIAIGLETAGYGTWCYEIDALPGASYLLQTSEAIETARVLLILISRPALQSRQLTRELVRAYECGLTMIPVLVGLEHAEVAARQPGGARRSERSYLCASRQAVSQRSSRR